MEVRAVSRDVRVSPKKLRGFADSIRGRSVGWSIAFLKSFGFARAIPMIKTLDSAFANATSSLGVSGQLNDFIVKRVTVDEGRVFKSFSPSAMGRASMHKRRLSIITVVLDKVAS